MKRKQREASNVLPLNVSFSRLELSDFPYFTPKDTHGCIPGNISFFLQHSTHTKLSWPRLLEQQNTCSEPQTLRIDRLPPRVRTEDSNATAVKTYYGEGRRTWILMTFCKTRRARLRGLLRLSLMTDVAHEYILLLRHYSSCKKAELLINMQSWTSP